MKIKKSLLLVGLTLIAGNLVKNQSNKITKASNDFIDYYEKETGIKNKK